MQLNEWLKSHGYVAAVGAALNGEFFRFDHGGNLNGFFKGRMVGQYTLAMVGDWKSGDIFYYRSECPPEEVAGLEAEFKRLQEEEAKLRAERQEEVAEKALNTWVMAIDRGVTPYLTRKGLKKLYGTKICPDYPDTLLVPMRDVSGKIWGLQRVLPHKLDSGLDKLFPKGGRIKGCFHLIGEIEPEGEIYICEGFATGASLAECLGKPVACAFNAGNVESVSLALREQYPHAKLIICGDDDRWSKRPDDSPWNPGREKATLAATACAGVVVFPVFTPEELEKRYTDFNDLFLSRGAQAVKASIENPPLEPIRAPRGCEGLTPLPWGTTKKGAAIPPDPQKVADALLAFYGDSLIHQDEDLFRWVGTHWKHLEKPEIDLIYRQLQYLFSNKATFGKLSDMFSLFRLGVAPAPVDLWAPRAATAANFLDGTLHAMRGEDYKWTKEFRPHNPRDYLINVIHLEYKKAKANPHSEFRQMLARVFAGQPDADQLTLAVSQMYGACLLPFKPHLFLLHGPQGSGKSSLIMPAMRLVSQENWCSVQPHEFKGFLMESMIGKLVNFRTDISTTETISDDTIKMIEDRVPLRFDRKFKEAIYAPLPAIHIFGSNSIPAIQDGGSGAHTRRWTFIRMDAHTTTLGNYRHDFGNWVFDTDPYDILAFAIGGMDSFLASGHYSVPESGLAQMQEWQLTYDIFGQFFSEIRGGKIAVNNSTISVGENYRIEPKFLWEAFKGFCTESTNSTNAVPRIKKITFYAKCRGAGFRKVTINGTEHFAGLGVFEVQGGNF
jgi:hypothetical protein